MELDAEAKKTKQQGAEPPHHSRRSCHAWIINRPLLFAALFLTVNSAHSAYCSRHDHPTLAFVAFTYSDMMLLLLCLKKLDRESLAERKRRMKAAVWALVAGLGLAFAWRVGEVMPPAVGFIVWLTSGTVVVGGFYGLFIHREASGSAAAHEEALLGPALENSDVM